MPRPEVPAGWFNEHLAFKENREVDNPDEVLDSYSLIINHTVIELRRKPLDKDDPDIQDFLCWMSSQIHDMVSVSAQSSSICLYETGPKPLAGRRYNQGKLYEPVSLNMHEVIFFDDVIVGFVPESFNHDLLPGYGDQKQLFFGDNRRGIALSANQTITGLLVGGALSSYPRLQADAERP